MAFDFSWRELVRRRPGMYIGPLNARAIYGLIGALIDQALADFRNPPCRSVAITLGRDNDITVELDGGVPSPASIAPTVEVVAPDQCIAALAATLWRPDEHNLHALPLLSAVAATLTVDLFAAAVHTRQIFAHGLPVSEQITLGPTAHAGLRITFTPDPAIFGAHRIVSAYPLIGHLRIVAALHPGLAVRVYDERDRTRFEAAFPAGLAGYLAEQLHHCWDVNGLPIVIAGERNGVRLVAALLLVSALPPAVESFVNGRPSNDGGSHVQGLWRGVVAGLNEYARRHGLLAPDAPALRQRTLQPPLAAAVAVWLPQPSYAGAMKGELSDPRAVKAVRAVVRSQLVARMEMDWPALATWLRQHVRQMHTLGG